MFYFSKICLNILIPFFGTVLGAFPVFIMKRKPKSDIFKILSGFAAGVMIAASVWSLIIPAIEMAGGKFAFVPAVSGFLTGIVLLAVSDMLISEIYTRDDKTSLMTTLAVTLHNIPEGMAVGVAIAGWMNGSTGIKYGEVLALTLGIAIQNIPEGAIISMPLKAEGKSKFKSFIYGAASGAVEPIAAVITVIVTGFIAPVLPFILSLAAGAMIYVVSEELIPSYHNEGNLSGTLSLGLGFAVMMALDVALG